jgi:hypothetical protein
MLFLDKDVSVFIYIFWSTSRPYMNDLLKIVAAFSASSSTWYKSAWTQNFICFLR